MNGALRVFAPIEKVQSTPDGGREVWGFATLERVDKSGEIADFEGTLNAVKNWSDEISRYTDGKSQGNIREQHTENAVGKVLQWEPGEKTVTEDGNARTYKGVRIGVRVPPKQAATIEKIDEGILTGFSIGGRYEKRWWDEAEKAYRYIPSLAEISLVDNPAVPDASFDMVKSHGDGYDIHVDLFKSADSEALHEAQQARADKYGIAPKDGGHLTPPADKPTSDTDYGDPVNYAYPMDSAHIKAAVGYFNHPDMRAKGGYSEAEWEKIGTRIADAANREIGDGHTFKDGVIETKEAHKSMENALQGQTPEVTKAADPDKEVDAKIAALEKELAELKAAQAKDDEDDKEEAEKATQAADLIKSITDRLEKKGVAVSASRAQHLRHAMDHIHAALGDGDKVQDRAHTFGEMDKEPMDAEKLAEVVFQKLGGAPLQKSAPEPVDVASVLAHALENAGLAKGVEVSKVGEDVAKAVETLSQLEARVKAIEEQPQPGGPMTSVYPGLGGAMPWQQNVEKTALHGMLEKTQDPVLKDALGRQLAMDSLAAEIGQNRRPTA